MKAKGGSRRQLVFLNSSVLCTPGAFLWKSLKCNFLRSQGGFLGGRFFPPSFQFLQGQEMTQKVRHTTQSHSVLPLGTNASRQPSLASRRKQLGPSGSSDSGINSASSFPMNLTDRCLLPAVTLPLRGLPMPLFYNPGMENLSTATSKC
jgi:hypothetical protein